MTEEIATARAEDDAAAACSLPRQPLVGCVEDEDRSGTLFIAHGEGGGMHVRKHVSDGAA